MPTGSFARRARVSLLCVGWLGGLLAQSGCSEAPERPRAEQSGTLPNVILIVVDTLRADHLTQYGYALDTSSVLSLLTDRATRFEECYSPAVWTAPAVASLFSGLAPTRHNVDRVGAALGEEVVTLAETLRNGGFDTAAFSFNPHVSRKARFDQGFSEFVGYHGTPKRAPDIRAMLREAGEWIAEEADAPFFLYLQPMNVHGPYHVPDDARGLLLGRPPKEDFVFFGPLMKELMNKRKTERREEVTAEFVESLFEKYDTAIRHTAEELGRFFTRLDDASLFDDALIILTADHGEELFDHGGFAHRYTLHREILHVPLFVKLPGQRVSARVAEPVSLTDVHATLLALLGQPSADTDSTSLVPLLEPDAPVPEALRDRSFVAVATNRKRCVGRALRKGRHALLEVDRSYDREGARTELYDLAVDPGEAHDLSRRDPELRAALRLALSVQAEAEADPSFAPVEYTLTAAERAALESLGYAEEDPSSEE